MSALLFSPLVMGLAGPAVLTTLGTLFKTALDNGLPLDPHIAFGMQLLGTALKDKRPKLANGLAGLGIDILRYTLELQHNKDRKAIARRLSKVVVSGLNDAVKSGFRDQVVIIIEGQSRIFSDAIRMGDEQATSTIAQVGIILLMDSIEDSPAELQPSWSITQYLSRIMVLELDRGLLTTRPLVERCMDTIMEEFFTDFTKEKNNKNGVSLIKAVIEMIKMAVSEKKMDIFKMFAMSIARTQERALAEGKENKVWFVLREVLTAVSSAIKNLKMRDALAISEWIQELLTAAINTDARELMGIISESWLTKIDEITQQDGHTQVAQDLMKPWAEKSCNTKATWKTTIELLSGVRPSRLESLTKADLAGRMSLWWVNALQVLIDEGSEDQIESIIRGTMNQEGAPSVSINLLLTSIKMDKVQVTRCLAGCWAWALEDEIERNHDKTAEGMLNTARRSYREALARGDREEAGLLLDAAHEIWKVGQVDAAVQGVLQSAEWIEMIDD
ncbi:uncharacterized protein TRIVIDRAFT_204009 [Trichoderma virens Gv29-8]|uniref:Uncharacterized protein n=1 Tax=Hypocrea virens (strain Gv29-8 / FGSC 10586) TaxID=413071 RepID=G9N2F8_HYPVG|nr:uncharacterized protein TRIVIDRAFT_204009 [Trichoderma virens Gv29-8]EHK19269.1 hypothetical protein TRIVIDRAFT_204009 [Trichoderma virens Gv29-8]UKZ49277.1 hypothetical protein TrVGV298_003522 [Trichoderma virens]